MSSSILNKFAPAHSIFMQQLNKLKDHQVDYIEQQQLRETLEHKAMLRRQLKGYESPKNVNELQAKMLERKNNRSRLYSENKAKMVNTVNPDFPEISAFWFKCSPIY